MELKGVCSAVYGVNLTCKTVTNHSGTLCTTIATLIPIIVLIQNTRSIQHMTLLPFVDELEGVTHAVRSSEYHDRNAQYHRILQDMGLWRVEIYEFSRPNMVYTHLRKRKLLWFLQNKKVDDWTDPRYPTVQGVVLCGLKIEALIQFILEQGASKNLNLMEWDKLWTINKKIIDPVCARHTAVLKDQCVLLTLTNGPEKPFIRILPRHKKHEGAGKKATTFTNRI